MASYTSRSALFHAHGLEHADATAMTLSHLLPWTPYGLSLLHSSINSSSNGNCYGFNNNFYSSYTSPPKELQEDGKGMSISHSNHSTSSYHPHNDVTPNCPLFLHVSMMTTRCIHDPIVRPLVQTRSVVTSLNRYLISILTMQSSSVSKVYVQNVSKVRPLRTIGKRD